MPRSESALHPIGDLGADLRGDRLPVQDPGRHGAQSYRAVPKPTELNDGSGGGP